MNARPRPPFNVAQELQRSLAAEYQAPGLSGFSNTSSLYQNTPAFRQGGMPPQGLHGHGEREKLPEVGMWNDGPKYQR